MTELILSSNQLSNNFEVNFARYLQEIQKFPILKKEEEYNLALKIVNFNDKDAAKILVQSHLRLVAKMAFQFKKYGLSIADLVSEGNLGLIQAVQKFDPIKGFRFSTYAMLWVKAYMQDYILKSWSLVKIGTNAAQRKLFFNLGKIKRSLGIENQESITIDNITKISNNLNVSEKEVANMNSRICNGDTSLNNVISEDGAEVGETIPSKDPLAEEIAITNQETQRKAKLVNLAMKSLNDREKDIFTKRKLLEKSITLNELSDFYNISRERVRQIEANAITKIKKFIESSDI
ncbi:RNA polymerase factor sigma-32 [Rickettsiales bacterium]|nr:RNA polymerase factor sigma-32 [Rickettsiales bacterium]